MFIPPIIAGDDLEARAEKLHELAWQKLEERVPDYIKPIVRLARQQGNISLSEAFSELKAFAELVSADSRCPFCNR